jgi:two-component system phosphate regulon sensor histidine kinase PhoR
MTGRVFTKLLFSFLLVLCLATAVLDFTVRRFAQHSLYARVSSFYGERAASLGAQLAATPPALLAAVVQAQALGTGADITVSDRAGNVVANGIGNSSRAPVHSIHPKVPAILPEQTSPRPFAGINPIVVSGSDPLRIQVEAGPYRAEYAFSLAGLHATLDLLQRDLLLASLLAFCLATFMAAFLAQRVATRLSRIVRFANRIAAGELSARLQEGRLDEISEVAHALDTTAVRLEASFKALDGSRRELAVLLDSMQEAVIGISPASQVTWSNSKMKAISPGVVREGRPLVECVRDPDVLRCVEAALQQNTLGRGRATSFVPGRAFAVSAAPMPGGGAVVVLHDVTEVERAERMRRDFVANVSHELRTPLTSISGYVETVLESGDSLSDQAREFLEIVLRNATRMNRLTADLLALASVEAGDYRITPQRIAADALLDDALEALAGMTIDSGVRLERVDATSTPVLADLDAMNQVFGNLIENAMKYGRTGGRVRLGAREEGETVEFFVQDFGPGIASEHLERIFERFYRVDKARSRDSGGTGLGLAIVRHIVLAHKGTIRAESELGEGAMFLFTLPRDVS